jgi:hypothetical protein
MKCEHCFCDIKNNKHTGFCPYNPVNMKKIAYFMKEYAETESKFNVGLKPTPTALEFDTFLKLERIMRVKTIRRRYLVEMEVSLEDWLIEHVWLAFTDGLVSEEDFPPYLLHLWDTWVFRSKEEYRAAYRLAMDYEDGDNFWQEVGVCATMAKPGEAKLFQLPLDNDTKV